MHFVVWIKKKWWINNLINKYIMSKKIKNLKMKDQTVQLVIAVWIINLIYLITSKNFYVNLMINYPKIRLKHQLSCTTETKTRLQVDKAQIQLVEISKQWIRVAQVRTILTHKTESSKTAWKNASRLRRHHQAETARLESLIKASQTIT